MAKQTFFFNRSIAEISGRKRVVLFFTELSVSGGSQALRGGGAVGSERTRPGRHHPPPPLGDVWDLVVFESFK